MSQASFQIILSLLCVKYIFLASSKRLVQLLKIQCAIFHQDLHSTLEAQDRRIDQEQKREKKRLTKLLREIEEATEECHDFTTRIKV